MPVQPSTVGLWVDPQAVLGEDQLTIAELHSILRCTEEGTRERVTLKKWSEEMNGDREGVW